MHGDERGGAGGDGLHRGDGSQPPGGYLDATEEWEGGAFAAPQPVAPAHAGARGTAPPAPPPRAPAAEAVPHAAAPREVRRGHGTARGIARNVQLVTGANGAQTLVFRLDRYDEHGNRLQPVGVQMSGYQGGQLSDGEHVLVSGRWRAGTLRARSVLNETTGARVKGLGRGQSLVLGTAVFLIFALIAWIAISGFILGP